MFVAELSSLLTCVNGISGVVISFRLSLYYFIIFVLSGIWKQEIKIKPEINVFHISIGLAYSNPNSCLRTENSRLNQSSSRQFLEQGDGSRPNLIKAIIRIEDPVVIIIHWWNVTKAVISTNVIIVYMVFRC